MANISGTLTDAGIPAYLGRDDPSGRLAAYRPVWVGKPASDVPLEGSILDAVQGADAVRTVVGGAGQLYDRKDFNFLGPWDENSFIEDYTADVRGVPVGAFHLVTFNADGDAQYIVVNYRPLSAFMYFSRLPREKLVGTPYAEHLAGEAERP